MKAARLLFLATISLLFLWGSEGRAAEPSEHSGLTHVPPVPGVVIDHSPAESGLFIGSPGLAVLINDDYLASHDFFGPQSREFEAPITAVFLSNDRGQHWRPLARVTGQFWSSLFVHRGATYLLGTDKHHGRIVIRRSNEGGATWTTPQDSGSGLLTPSGQYHTAPVPVIEHRGRLWRGFEDAMGGTEWGKRYRAGVISIPTNSDLLQAANWTLSNFLPRHAEWLDAHFNAWLEGNAVVSPEGHVLDILRVDLPGLPEKAALVQLSDDGRTTTFEATTGFVDFPGGAKIQHSRRSQRAWLLVSGIHRLNPYRDEGPR